jgi:nitrogen fixation-related uncharacterized protein
MSGIVLLLMIGVALGVGVLVLASVFGGVGQGQEPDTETWRRVNAEVVSVLRTSTSTFLLVRYVVGTSLIHNDVRYPLPGAVPHAGQRVPIRFDPMTPARAVFDWQASTGTPPKVAGPA